MAKKVGKIAKEKRPFDKTYIPLAFAILVLVVLIVALVVTIVRKPKSKPENNNTNTANIEEMVVDLNSTSCSNDDLKQLASEAKNITAKFEEIDDYVFFKDVVYKVYSDDSDEPHDITGYALRMTIENVPLDEEGKPKFKILIKNNIDSTEMLVTETPDGKYVWDEGDTAFVRTYYVTIKTNTEYCKDVNVRSFSFQVPKWNEMSKQEACNNELIKDKDICKRFVYSDKSFNALFEELAEEGKKAGKEEYRNNGGGKDSSAVKFMKKHYYIFIIIGIVIVVALIVVLVLKGRKRNEK